MSVQDQAEAFLTDALSRIQQAQLSVPASTKPMDESLARIELDAWWAGLTVPQRATVFAVSQTPQSSQSEPCDDPGDSVYDVVCPACGAAASEACWAKIDTVVGRSFARTPKPHASRYLRAGVRS